MGEENRCFVGGLSWATDDRLLSEAFAQYGVADAKVRKAPRHSLFFFSLEQSTLLHTMVFPCFHECHE